MNDKEIVELAGVSKRTLTDARKALSRIGLVVCDRQPGPGRYTYTLCDPVTGLPYPGDPKDKVVYKKKSSSPASKPAEAADETPAERTEKPDAPPFEAPPSNKTTRPEGIDLCDTDFPFGPC